MIRKTIYLLFGLFSSYLFTHCQWNELEVSDDPNFRLEFSTDTIFFDTIFSSLNEFPRVVPTQRLYIYNRTSSAVEIESIVLEDLSESYSMAVNGVVQEEHQEVFLGKNDSILILINAQIPFEDTPEILEKQGSISFSTNGQEQRVVLTSWANNPVYHSEEILSADTYWEAGRDHLILDSVRVLEGATLTIQEGAHLLFDQNGKLQIEGSIQAIGTCEDSILFTTAENKDFKAVLPGAWGGIELINNSFNNAFEHCLILNAQTGIDASTLNFNDSDTLHINESTISNMASRGIHLTNRHLKVLNSQLNNTLKEAIYKKGEGLAQLNHNTITNGLSPFFRADPTIQILQGEVELTNSIVWGDFGDQLIIQDEVSRSLVAGNLLMTENTDWSDANILNEDPNFQNNLIASNVYFLSIESPCIDASSVTFALETDITCFLRENLADIGAFEFRELPE